MTGGIACTESLLPFWRDWFCRHAPRVWPGRVVCGRMTLHPCVVQAFRHPNLLALEDFSFAADGSEAILLFDYFARGTLLQAVQGNRYGRALHLFGSGTVFK